jgi:predicted dinucleotide-binding enzyme
MKIGIIGAGSIGRAFAAHVAKVGYDVVLSNSRGPESLRALASQLGSRATAATRQEAAGAEVVMIAVPWSELRAAMSDLPAWGGRILIDATNPVVQPGYRLADLGGSTSSEIVASLAPGARVVKVANTLRAALLAAEPRESGGHRALFMAGDDSDAKSRVRVILESVGFATVDLGSLQSGGPLQQFPGGSLPNLNLIRLP